MSDNSWRRFVLGEVRIKPPAYTKSPMASVDGDCGLSRTGTASIAIGPRVAVLEAAAGCRALDATELSRRAAANHNA
jgi:hypothetical protein